MQLSLDDFGTGYSSLSYLHRYPFHALKIDRSFVSGIGQNENQTAIVKAIIAMAHSLHLKVIAEGVESAQQVAFLKAHGCLAAQGFYYSGPVAAEAIPELQCEAHML
jgi:EAL domain-containing protein (putative c-di-GMP-specific phosphodiesterase class I)